MSDLDKLIEAVRAGDLMHADIASLAYACGEPLCGHRRLVRDAYASSLDAALALFKELLPGWDWVKTGDGSVGVYAQKGRTYGAHNPDSARALLLATLTAYRAVNASAPPVPQ